MWLFKDSEMFRQKYVKQAGGEAHVEWKERQGYMYIFRFIDKEL